MVRMIMISVISLLLVACAGEPQKFTEGDVARQFAPVQVVCNESYVAPDKIQWTYSLPPDAMMLQNSKELADEIVGGTSSLNYSLWIRDEMARQCIDTNLVFYTNQYGNKEFAVEYKGWLAIQQKGFVGHARDVEYAIWHEIGHPSGEWREIK